MKKHKRITAKSVIASILIVALLFNVVSPAYARDGNVGDSNTWTAMAMGAFNGATASSTIGWTQWAVNLFVQVAVDYADLYYFMHNYSEYGRSVISLNIGGAHINITRGQMVRMVASAAASTVAGFATGSGISVGTVVNNLTNSFTRMMISSAVSQILVKKFGLDPNLASIATTLITNYISEHWNLITSIIPQAGTMIDELIDPQDQQLKHTKEFLKKLKANSDEESKKGEGKSTEEGSDKTFTKEELYSGIKLTENTLANLKKQRAQLDKEWWHLSAARNEARKEELDTEIKNQQSFLDGLNQLKADVENNSEVRKSPNWAPLKSAQDSIVGGLRSAMDKRSDPVAKAIKKGVDNVVIKGLTIVDPSLPKRIEESKPQAITVDSKSNPNVGTKDTGANLSVGQEVKLMVNGVPTESKITAVNDDGKYTAVAKSDNRALSVTKTTEGYVTEAVDVRVGDIIPLVKNGEMIPTHYMVKAANNNGKYTAITDTDNRPYYVTKTEEGYSVQAVDVRVGDIIPLAASEGEAAVVNYTVKTVDNGKYIATADTDNRPYAIAKTEEGYTIQAMNVPIGEISPVINAIETRPIYTVKAVNNETRLTTRSNNESFNISSNYSNDNNMQPLTNAEATLETIRKSFNNPI